MKGKKLIELLNDNVVLNKKLLMVGQTIYRIMGENSLAPQICSWEIVEIEIFVDEVVYVDDSGNKFTDDDIGKTVFRTIEDAKEALNELFKLENYVQKSEYDKVVEALRACEEEIDELTENVHCLETENDWLKEQIEATN